MVETPEITEFDESMDGARKSMVAACNYELNWQRDRILNCLTQLNDVQVWLRPCSHTHDGVKLNRIGDLIRHLDGNLSQWMYFGLTRDKQFQERDRIREFEDAKTHTCSELKELINRSIDRALEAVNRATNDQWVGVHHVQSRNASGFGAVLHTSMHLYGHTQEIICLTKQILGLRYKPHQNYADDGKLSD